MPRPLGCFALLLDRKYVWVSEAWVAEEVSPYVEIPSPCTCPSLFDISMAESPGLMIVGNDDVVEVWQPPMPVVCDCGTAPPVSSTLPDSRLATVVREGRY